MGFPLNKFVKKVYSRDRYFFTLIVIALFLSIPITVFSVLQSRDLRTEATHQDCFDLNGDFKVTQSDVDIILNTVAVGGYKPEYDINRAKLAVMIDVIFRVIFANCNSVQNNINIRLSHFKISI